MSEVRATILAPDEVAASPNIRDEWEKLVRASNNLRVLYQSPVWWDCNFISHICQPSLVVMRDRSEAIVGMCPVRFTTYPLSLHLFNRCLWANTLDVVEVLAGTPLASEDDNVHLQLFRFLLDSFPACEGLLLRNVRSDSFCWTLLESFPHLRSGMLAYAPEGVGQFHTISLPATFPEYLAKFKRDTRKKLQRKVGRLERSVGGDLELMRIESADQVDFFLDTAAVISDHTWQKHHLGRGVDTSPAYRALLRCCGERGILRSYLLRCGEAYCSFGIGFQFQQVYHYVQIGFDERWTELSPGTVQFFLVLRDLIEFRPARRLDFGHGDWQFKRLFGTETVAEMSVLLLRGSFRNRLKTSGHATWCGAVRRIKHAIGRNRDFRRPRTHTDVSRSSTS